MLRIIATMDDLGGNVFRALIDVVAVGAVTLTLAAPISRADTLPNCAPKDWYQICAYPDKHYEVCNLSFNGACQPMMAPGQPVPSGIPTPP
jgi:hypothetical protein